jgi:2-oxoglutarate dehydrogenase E1 component
MSGLVMLLPHGYEGQGPEHSSARPERFLQQCAEDNIQVVNCSSPANYFHVLRRQIHRNFRKPLIIMTPKSLLRHKLAISPLSKMLEPETFHRVLYEPNAPKDPKSVRRVVLCTGKVYYDLLEAKLAKGQDDVTFLRVEQLYPFPADVLATELAKYPNAEVVWCQEEPQNMGYWTFMDRRIEAVLTDIKHPTAQRPRYVGRPEAASPATGYAKRHEAEQNALVEEALNVGAAKAKKSVKA